MFSSVVHVRAANSAFIEPEFGCGFTWLSVDVVGIRVGSGPDFDVVVDVVLVELSLGWLVSSVSLFSTSALSGVTAVTASTTADSTSSSSSFSSSERLTVLLIV